MMISKIADRHLSREACIYIRQSTMGQVRFNQESTERQYNLASKAQALGWSSERIRVLDRDLGQSGARTTNREDFKTLVSDVAMGQVGAIFSLEASRLARSNQDWHRLLELCAITSTLVIDEDGCYDPAEFNDGLVLGMKGTFAQAELHIIRARLHGGKINKAHKGELHRLYHLGSISRQPPTPGGEPDQLRSPRGASPRGSLFAAGPVALRHLRAPPGCALYRQWRPLPDLSVQLEASGSPVTTGLHECGLKAARRRHC